MIREREFAAWPGLPVAIGLLGLIVLLGYEVIDGARSGAPAVISAARAVSASLRWRVLPPPCSRR